MERGERSMIVPGLFRIACLQMKRDGSLEFLARRVVGMAPTGESAQFVTDLCQVARVLSDLRVSLVERFQDLTRLVEAHGGLIGITPSLDRAQIRQDRRH